MLCVMTCRESWFLPPGFLACFLAGRGIQWHFPAWGTTTLPTSLPLRLADEMLCSPRSCYQCNNLPEIADLVLGGILVLPPTTTNAGSGFSGSSGFSSVHPPLLLAGVPAQPHKLQACFLGSLSLTFRFPSVKSSWSISFETLTWMCSHHHTDSLTIPW